MNSYSLNPNPNASLDIPTHGQFTDLRNKKISPLFLSSRMVGMIEDLKKKVEEKEAMKEDLSGRLDGTLKILAGVRAGQEHIAEKLEVALFDFWNMYIYIHIYEFIYIQTN